MTASRPPVGSNSDSDADVADLYGAVASALLPLELSTEQRDRMRRKMLARAIGAPPPAGTATWRASDAGWITSSPLIEAKLLRIDAAAGTQELLIRFLPGVVVPAHTHLREEQMIILEGECLLGEHPLRAGDVHIAPAGSSHPQITSATGTLLLLLCEYPFPPRL